jgi:hypothetical protein
MSIQRFEPGDIEFFSIQTVPSTTFVSSSTGVTGAVYVYPRRSNAIKDYYVNWAATVGAPTGSFQQINDITDVLGFAKQSTTPAEFHTRMSQYLDVVKNQPTNPRNNQKQEVVRFTPGVNLALDMTRKFVTTNVLMPYYSLFGTNYNFAFTNYSSLNFLTASNLPTGSALLYPASGSAIGDGYIVSSSYIPSGAFSFDFWINPKYTNDNETSEFKAGTLFHLSGAYALSLLSGSGKDSNGLIDGYRLLLQLSSSAKTPPSNIDPSSTSGLYFVSNDNCLKRNVWQHVTVRWGTNSYNFGSGSFMVNGVEQGTFYIPSASVAPKQENNVLSPSILTIGNFLECADNGPSAYFFSDRAKLRYGVPVSGSAFVNYIAPSYDEPSSYYLRHPLNAEVHELKIYNKYLSQIEIASRSLSGAPLDDPNLLFYLPPMFTKESPSRGVDMVQGLGGVLVHPFQCVDGTTEHPFNVDLSFDTGGHYINLENWTRDFATGNYPRLIQLTGSALVGNTEQLTANQFLYNTGSVRKASITVLPNDNGQFVPNYYQLLNNLNTSSFVTDKGQQALNLISLRNMYSLNSIYDLVAPSSGSAKLNTDTTNSGSIISALSGFDSTSSFGTLNPQKTPTILQRTQENGSLQVVLFDISNLFYGNKIAPGTFTLSDTNVSNSFGKVSITLKDDGYGNLYRADCIGSQAQYNSVGNIFYDNGIVLIKNPSLYWFGENGFTCSFKGERNIHVMKTDLYANPLELVSSSNPSWNRDLQANDNPSDFDKRYVYITDLYLHDDNLNVIARTKIAQPVLKRSGDRLKFTMKIDF